ncbi:hypothetical protein [Cloacibacterium sp.]|uniref:hypothetical protein n=1 Tax=Cloacibacterium sp. TaxID=1913682 RepID=UPI0039E5D38C
MKTFLSILIIGFGMLFSDSFSYSKSKNLHGGRCTGSANCTACSSCSRCGHCNSGGTCEVCSGAYSEKSYYSTQEKNAKQHGFQVPRVYIHQLRR